VKKSIITT